MKQIIKERIETINRGEIPFGYKKIVNSVVPIDWEQKYLEQLFIFYGGLGKSRDELGDKGVPYLHYGDMHRNIFTKVSYEQYLNEPRYDMLIKGQETFLLEDGDVVFLDASEDLEGTARTVMIDNPENRPFISGLHTIRGKSKKDYLQKEFKQYITEPFYVKKQFKKLASGFKVYGLNRETIKKIELAYPKDKKEQQKIAEILSFWDNVIVLQERLIQNLEIKKKALMQKILSTKIGWKKVQLGDICSITTGKLDVNAMSENGEYPFFTCAKERFYINEHAFDTEAILISGNGANVGYVHYYNGKFNAYQRTYVLSEFKENILLIKFVLDQYLKRQIDNEKNEGNTPYIVLSTLTKMNISIPSSESEQLSLANTLLSVEKTVDLNNRKLEVLKQQQRAIKQLLLTGIVRVN